MIGVPDHVELRAARAVVADLHPRTPLYRLDDARFQAPGREVYVKYENHGPVGSFKARGALYSLWRLDAASRARGVVTASTGNHGRGVAYAGALLGVPVTIVIPESTPVVKRSALERFEVDLRTVPGNLSDAAALAEELATANGRHYIEDGEDAGLMAGAATVAHEVLDELPDADTMLVPVGGGNLIAGIALAARERSPGLRIVGVQSEAAPSVKRSWDAGEVTQAPCSTFAGGLATLRPGHLAFDVIKDRVDAMMLVGESELERAIVRVLESTGQMAEGAGAAAFAGLTALGAEQRGKVVLVLSGGNLGVDELQRLLNDRTHDLATEVAFHD